MNTTQTNYLLDSFLRYSVCSNEDCPMWLSTFETSISYRCPICNEPALLPSSLAPVISNTKSRNVYERYLPSYIVDILKKENLLRSASNIGDTPLSTNRNIDKWVGIENLYLKEENKNPSGAFKDRGSFMAIALLAARLKIERKNNTRFTLGTVSTGNMAISTPFMVNQVKRSNHNFDIRSFVVVSSNMSQKKIDAIQKAAGETGTTLFIVNGEYAKFHDLIYRMCANLRIKGIPIFPQLTDDVFRISGYGTLFAEIIDQMKNKVPDFIIVPIASGALGRVAIWSVEALFRKGFVKKLPRIVLVQEKGGDPVMYAMRHSLPKIEIIQVENGTVADGIVVSNSRSGNPLLKVLRENYHIGISVNAKEILEAQNTLHNKGFFAEEASCASVAAARKLKSEGIISRTDTVVSVLTGSDIKKRHLPKVNPAQNRIINCKIENLQDKMMEAFSRKTVDMPIDGIFC